MNSLNSKPHVVVLGGNFAGLGSAQKIRQYAKDAVTITVIDRKDFLLFVPNIPADVFENRNPALHQRMELRPVLAHDDINFIQADVQAIDVDAKTVEILPNERPGAAKQTLAYDYLVVALGNRLAYDDIEGFAEFGDSVSDLYLGKNYARNYILVATKAGRLRLARRALPKAMARWVYRLIRVAVFRWRWPPVRAHRLSS